MDRISAAQDRFLLGLDEDENVIPEALVSPPSVADYGTFLAMTSASGGAHDTKRERVRWSNASALFEP